MGHRIVIVDDEAIARRKLRRILTEYQNAEVVAECSTGDDAVQAIATFRPDIVFLDIQMPGGDGFSVVQRVGVHAMPPTVFVTAYDHHAVRAFQVHAADYLLKPVSAERVAEAYARACQRLTSEQTREDLRNLLLSLDRLGSNEPAAEAGSGGRDSWLEWFLVGTARQSKLIPVEQVYWIEAAGNYVRLHLRSESHLCRESLNSLSARLPPRQFVRVHRSAIVQIPRIQTISSWFGGDQLLHLEGGAQVKLSRNYRRAFEQRIQKSPAESGS